MAEMSGDGRYKRYLMEEAENEFINRAVKSIAEGKDWEGFIGANPQYTLSSRAKWHNEFDQMRERYTHTKIGEWGLGTEMEFARNRRRQAAQRESDERIYQECRADMLALAAEHCGWREASRRLDLPADYEKYYRRAQTEAGVYKSSERQDPQEAAFELGFFS